MYSVTIKDGQTERTFSAPTADEALRMAGLSPLAQRPFEPISPVTPDWRGPSRSDRPWWEVQCGGAITGGAVTLGGWPVAIAGRGV